MTGVPTQTTPTPAQGADPAAAELSDAVRLSDAALLYRAVRLIRRFEETAIELVRAGEISGGIHPYIGEEAVAAGVCAALRPDDYITSTHRGHGHVLAKGADPARVLAEIAGRATGLQPGRPGCPEHLRAAGDDDNPASPPRGSDPRRAPPAGVDAVVVRLDCEPRAPDASVNHQGVRRYPCPA